MVEDELDPMLTLGDVKYASLPDLSMYFFNHFDKSLKPLARDYDSRAARAQALANELNGMAELQGLQD
jgi:hypothetical protein